MDKSRSGTPILGIALLGTIMLIGTGCKNGMAPSPVVADETPVPRVPPGKDFQKWWQDGAAELSSYDVKTPRYNEIRTATEVFIYVTEPMDRETWIKDDRGKVPKERRENVLKLNRIRRFQTGVYDYSVMTSVFTLVDRADRERFAPVRITNTIQEWCGHTYFRGMPSRNKLMREIRSYFSHEGEKHDEIPVPIGTVYEEALFVQLRELDDPFADGKKWSGKMIPSYWHSRKDNALPAPLNASITRSVGDLNGEPTTHFTIVSGPRTIVMEIEKKAPRRILEWRTSDGETGKLKKTVRLPYWNLKAEGDESYLKQLDL